MSLMLLLLLLHSGFRQAVRLVSVRQTRSPVTASLPIGQDLPAPCSGWLTRDMTLTHSNHQRLWAGSCDSEQVS